MRVVTITATHRAFKNFVMKRHAELRLNFTVTTGAQLRIVRLQHPNRREPGLLGIRGRHLKIRAGYISAFLIRVRRVTVSATNVIPPVLATSEIVPLFLARMARKTSLRDFFRRFVLEGNNLGRIALFRVRLAGAMTRFTASHFVFPTAYSRKCGV